MTFGLITHLLGFLFLLLPLLSVSQTYRNISLGSSLYAANDNYSSWTSPSGEFAFGFQAIGTRGFLLSIWFNKLPDKTIVWSANRDKLVQRGSKIELTTDGRLVLNDSQGREVWNASLINMERASYAAMLDSGNFVLANQNSTSIWETFDIPTDTILPTQTLNKGSRLVSRRSETDFSSGRFQLRWQDDGSPTLCRVAFPTDKVYNAYWKIKATNTSVGLVFNETGKIFLAEIHQSTVINPSENGTTRDSYQRATLDFDGVFRHYVYPKTISKSDRRSPYSWSPVWFVPENICTAIFGPYGSGACGFNSYCILDENKKPNCECPPGYTLIDPNNKWNGCKQNFVSQRCEEGSQEASLYDMIPMVNTDWPLSDSEDFSPVDENWCTQTCLNDCFCAVAIIRDGHCWKKKLPMGMGRTDPSVGGKALIKVPKGYSSLRQSPGMGLSEKKHQTRLILIGSFLIGCSLFLLLLAISLVTYHLYRKRQQKSQPHQAMPALNVRNFTFKELEEATEGFNNLIGSGAFATVYKGTFVVDNKVNFVAVKKLDKLVKENQKEFDAEVSAIGTTNHKNLVQLLGFCNEGEHYLLVYEFMNNGSLATFLFGSSKPDWNQRVRIAFGIASGLAYLHEECNTQIIHCDIKPQNILLDDSFTARISDFGLAKLLKVDQTQTNTDVRGTKGYVAPEWFNNRTITSKVDVYSYGVMLLEILCCRRKIEPQQDDENKVILMDWAYECYMEGKLDKLVENDDDAMDDKKRLEKFVRIAMWCIQEDPSRRPTMKKVTQMLEGAIEVLVPPMNPSSSIN
ncbi:PREDICTED: G-type lectin S-receptor-like serine/threonine-protein kinase LECRK3 [Nelumbo nucifera]|uniref:Receptor-like serine/threonine-protein kinase n=2 Tax=Nelumbo nucifera TaxID=4432 RepID=A0A1U8AIZ0_NELNU|nr:PREDICTED: G-type lectin S-receptor-like serine/threonine-protein kinase LECRK3 [Nelumbo nucifera]XP_010265868.1 PREDICTED: G-type lectin S-receptor-like serine/threonine-protein kinase LECRK3 [Nelumbo nucifera]DAD29971.1 TPA_asm: hypothetical protein HUJ06_031439 [Nelumbo nucifera]